MATFPKAMTKKNSNGRLKIRRRSGDINFFSSRYLSDKSEASRDAMAEWYMISWNAEVSRVFFRSCFAFSSVKHPSANLDPARVGSEPGSLLLAFCPGSALMYSAGSEDQPKSGVHQLAEADLRRFGSDRWEAEAALGRIETGLKDVRGVAIVGAGSQCRKKQSPPPTSSVDPPEPVPEELETTLDKRRLEEKFAVLNTGVYECRSCGYKYDEAVGDPSYPVPPGLPFDKLPEDWRCPTCGAAQGFFVSKSVEIAGFAQNQQFGLGGNTLTSGQKAVLIFGGLFLFFVLFLSGYFLQ